MASPKSLTRLVSIFVAVGLGMIVLSGAFFLGDQYGRFQSLKHFTNVLEGQEPVDTIERPAEQSAKPVKAAQFSAKGQVTAIDADSITVSDKLGTEKVLSVNAKTQVRLKRQLKSLSDIQLGDMILAIGKPIAAGGLDTKYINVLSTIH